MFLKLISYTKELTQIQTPKKSHIIYPAGLLIRQSCYLS